MAGRPKAYKMKTELAARQKEEKPKPETGKNGQRRLEYGVMRGSN